MIQMYPVRYLISLGILLFCIVYFTPVSAVTLSFQPSQVTMDEGSTASMTLYASDFPTGLSGYNLTVSLSDGSIADIVNVTFPSWAAVHDEGSFPGDTVWVKAVDLSAKIQAGTTEVELCTLEIGGESAGNSDITTVVTQCDTDSGESLSPMVSDGEIIVIGDSPSPTPTPPPSSTTFSFSPAEASVETGNLVLISIIADQFPTGLSGYNLTVSLSDGSIADIVNVTFPSWAAVHDEGSFPGDTVWVKAVDLSAKIQAGATEVELCTLEIGGESAGNSDITIVVTQCDTDSGESLSPMVSDGEIIVIGDSPSPTPTPPPSSTTFSFSPAEASVETGNLVQISIIADQFPTGLSGYNLTVSLSDGSIADIVNVTFPSWAAVHDEGSFPGDTVWVKAVDLSAKIQAGATEVELCTLEIGGESAGNSDITIVVTQCDTDSGESLSPMVSDGEIIVIGDSPSPTPTPPPSSTTFSFSPAEASVETGNLVQISIIADQFPTGLSGYNLTVSLSDGSIADIVNVTFPSWATVHDEGSFPGDTVWVKAVDLNSKVQTNATDVELCTLEISGQSIGSSDIIIPVIKCDNDSGEILYPAVSAGKINVTNDVPAPSSTTFSFSPAEASVKTGDLVQVSIIADQFPTGLSGYNLTVSLADSSVADIVNVTFPSWATVHDEGSFPGDAVWVKAVDLNSEVQTNATDVELCTFEISGESVGNSDITIAVTQCDTDSGELISPVVSDGEIIVIGDSPSPTPTPPPSSTTFSFSPAEAYVKTGDLVQVSIIADKFPTGLSGYNLTVSLSDGSVAGIVNVTFPSWAAVHDEGSFPGDIVWVKAVDLSAEVQTGATDVELCTFEISGESVGSSDITLAVTQCDTDDGGTLAPTVSDGKIRVTSLLLGDANSDGDVNQADTLCVLKEVVGMVTSPLIDTDAFEQTDVHWNNVIDVGDAMYIAQYNVELRNKWFALI